MRTTTVHLPPKLIRALDKLAARTNVSRNRLVVEACERLVRPHRGAWPPGFVEGTHLSARDRRELETAGRELERAVGRARRSRHGDPLGRAGA